MNIKQGYLSIVGKPNVGKSTLTNTILKQKLSIISHKPQTTRNKIMGVFKDEDSYIILVDTPGFHKPKNKLDMFLNSEVKKSLKIADVVLFLLDSTRPIDHEDIEIARQLKVWNVEKIIPVISKMDECDTNIINLIDNFILENIENRLPTIKISCEDSSSIDNLIMNVKQNFEAFDEIVLPQEEQIDLSDKFVINEIIRETVLELCKHEVPYSTGVVTNVVQYEEAKNMLKIQADIIVEKDSQKPIVIGNKGTMIKKIGTNSRQKLLDIFDSKIFLELFVKVKKDWRDNNSYIIDMGYKK